MPPPDHKYIRCHMILDTKMEDFCSKAWLVASEHVMKGPLIFTYGSVISQQTVCIPRMLAVLNDIDIWTADALNAYTSPRFTKIWTTLGKEFGDDYGWTATEAALHMFSYLKLKSNSRLIFDTNKPDRHCHLSPNPLDKDVVLQTFLDSNHDGDKVSQCSRTSCSVVFLKCGVIDFKETINS
eukprot:CCRYP_017084-RA/>CCRYP_017084-RA protein AED:0.45 eAED:0.40 QI:0/0/0/0.66/0/0/3/0/181